MPIDSTCFTTVFYLS